MMDSVGDHRQQSWTAFLNGPIQQHYRSVLNPEIPLTEYDAKGKSKKKVATTYLVRGCQARRKKETTTVIGHGCTGRPKKKGEKACSPDKPKPEPYKRKAQGWFEKPV